MACHAATDLEVLIVGAGISGIGAGIELLRRGITAFAVLEAANALGGTWRDNTYPGIAVDIPSSSYCYSFETDFPWSRTFAPGAEIQRYVNLCAEKYGVARHIRYGSRVLHARFDSARNTWATHLDNGTVVTSRYLIAATGLFGEPKWPAIPGLDTFAGKIMHTARWEHGDDLAPKSVAVIGTGASQRTPIWISPRIDRPLPPSSRLSMRTFGVIRLLRRLLSEARLEFMTFSIVNYRRWPWFVWGTQRFLRWQMRRQVTDQAMAAKLLPGYGLGCKRPTTSNTYLPAFNRDNVLLITRKIERICPEGIVTDDQTLHEVDTIILATGFLTTEQGNAPSFAVVGSEGVELGQFWEDHRLQAYAGVSLPGFPNFFLTSGPYSAGFNWFTMLEANLTHIMKCLDGARERGATRVEVKRDVHERYMHHMWRRAEGTVFKAASCAASGSYYIDRHGDASLPLPHTPWWRAIRGRSHVAQGYHFSSEAG